jgi:hypothetical protein
MNSVTGNKLPKTKETKRLLEDIVLPRQSIGTRRRRNMFKEKKHVQIQR